jgi:hypothetical protein
MNIVFEFHVERHCQLGTYFTEVLIKITFVLLKMETRNCVT